ncbi:RecX family transcriptional regulator [Vibrio taketomensis]|uniref:RecX family transcriptional regulator n=1 Tax=Vibrio taketomensis TaxID=2572923 RepID=UPI001389C60C|nr:RecX family transcriptional regulator [Vibrio taketomensis]
MNSALWHLGQKDLTESELLAKLRVKTDNEEWITDTIEKLRDFGYLKSDKQFAEQFAERSFFGEYGSEYIRDKLKKKGIEEALIDDAIHKVKAQLNIDEQAMLNERINNYYQEFTMSKEKLITTLQKRGFSYAQVNQAIKQHACSEQLKTNLEIKAEKADLEKEVLKYARKGKGLTVIRQELRQRKIDITELDALVERLINREQLDFYSSCLGQLSKKSYDLSVHNERSKAYAMLSRKGFSSDEIRFAMDELTQ